MAKTHRLALALACLLLVTTGGRAEQPPAEHGHLDLSQGLTDLLRREMSAIQAGMQGLIPAIAAGDWPAVAETAAHIQHSYLMDQQLTQAQRAELQHALPPAFLELDQSFHRSAGMLAQAARRHDAEVVNFYVQRLLDGCVACHGRFATRRFPGLAGDSAAGVHTH